MELRARSRYGMVVDTRRCVGCGACVLECKEENEVPDGRSRRWVQQVVEGRFPELKMTVWSESCQHCEDPPCVEYCPTGASHIHELSGTVQVDHELCTGCKACMASCPYDARYVHPDGFVDKCTLCLHRLEEGRRTACEEVCPTSAIVVGDLDDPDSGIRRLLASRHVHQRKPEAGTRPKFFLLE